MAELYMLRPLFPGSSEVRAGWSAYASFSSPILLQLRREADEPCAVAQQLLFFQGLGANALDPTLAAVLSDSTLTTGICSQSVRIPLNC
jgi:hypothetical protein